MIKNVITKLLGSANDRIIKNYDKTVSLINDLEPKYHAMTDEELRNQTDVLRARLAAGDKEKDILGHKAVSVYINDSISYWVATDLLLSFPLNSNSNIFLPLEFDIENNGINLHLIATSISFDKPSKNEVEIPKDCNTITMEELQELLFEIQGGMLDDDDIDLDLEEDE